MSALGCGEHVVYLYDRCNERMVCEVEGVTSVEWSRVLDDTSEATVEVAVSGISPACCGCLGDARSWATEVVITRGDETVWVGPIVRLTYTSSTVTINARDSSAWLNRRVPHADLAFVATDLAEIAEALVSDALEPDGGCVLDVTTLASTGILGDREYVENIGYVGDHLDDLSRNGLDWTVVGRRMLLGPEECFGFGESLYDEHFLGDIQVVEDGLSLCTRAVVEGDGVVGTAGGVDPFFGLVECYTQEDSVLDLASANASAATIVDGQNPPPVALVIPPDSALRPETPIGINELIPGVCFGVATSSTCRELSATLRLTTLRVLVAQDGSETIGVTLAPPSATGGGGA